MVPKELHYRPPNCIHSSLQPKSGSRGLRPLRPKNDLSDPPKGRFGSILIEISKSQKHVPKNVLKTFWDFQKHQKQKHAPPPPKSHFSNVSVLQGFLTHPPTRGPYFFVKCPFANPVLSEAKSGVTVMTEATDVTEYTDEFVEQGIEVENWRQHVYLLFDDPTFSPVALGVNFAIIALIFVSTHSHLPPHFHAPKTLSNSTLVLRPRMASWGHKKGRLLSQFFRIQAISRATERVARSQFLRIQGILESRAIRFSALCGPVPPNRG